MLRIQLINDIVGSKVLELADPIDINSLTQTIKKSADFGGIVFEMILDLEFIKDGRDFIKQAYDSDQGVDTVTLVNLYEYNPNTRPRWTLAYTGQVNYNKFDLGEIDVIVNIEQTGVQRRVLNMMKIDVDQETEETENESALPPQDTKDVIWHSKVILKELNEAPVNDIEFQQANEPGFTLAPTGEDVTIDLPYYGQFEMEAEFSEIDGVFTTPYGFRNMRLDPSTGLEFVAPGTEEAYVDYLSVQERKDMRNPKVVIREAGVIELIDIKLTYKPTVFAVNTGGDIDINGDGCMGNLEVAAWFEHRDQFDNIITLERIGLWNTPGEGGNERVGEFETHSLIKNDVAVNIGDKFYVYPTYRIYGEYESPAILTSSGSVSHDLLIQPESANSHIIFKQASVDADREISTILIHEAFERTLQYITNQPVIFRSPILGRVDLGYAEDGEFALIGLTNGHRLRKKNAELPAGERGDNMFLTLEKLLKFINTIACVDFYFEIDENGKQIFVLDKKSALFNKNLKIASLGEVEKIRRKVAHDRFINKFEIGYSTEVDVQQSNATDEYNTIRRYTLPIINTNNELIVTTDIITSGYMIEHEKRLITKTEDGQNDDKIFAAVLVRDGEGFKTKENEGYQSIQNVLFPDTGYNYDISPARIAQNWFPFIASNFIRSKRKTLKFSFGTVNYIMTTQKDGSVIVIAENGSYDMTFVEPLFDNENYTFKCPVTHSIIKLIRLTPFGYLEFKDRHGNIFEGFISPEGIEYDRTKKTASFNLIRLYRP